jgi:hypothetical protein
MSLLGSGGGGDSAAAVAVSADLALCGDNVVHLHFDGSQGSKVFVDSAPGGGTLSCVGSTIALDQSSKKHGTASLFLNEVQSNYIVCPLRGRMTRWDTEATWECWINGNTVSVHDQRLLLSDPGGPGLYFKSDMRPVFTGSTLGGGAFEVVGTAVSTGAWHHIAATYSLGRVTLWVDGAVSGTPANLTYPLVILENNIYVGDYATNGGFNGRVDEVRVSRVSRYSDTFTPSASAFTDASAVSAGLLGELRSDGAGGMFICTNATTQDWRRVA